MSSYLVISCTKTTSSDVPQRLCPLNKRYDLMDANKKVDLENVQCPSESKRLMNIITNHPIRFSIAALASVPWIYMAQFWHTLKEDGSKNRLKFLLDRKELTLTLDDFRTIFHLPQENDNNHALFVHTSPSFSDMVPFYKQVLGFTMELKSVSNFEIPGLLQPWQTLCKILSKCLTTREDIYYSLHHLATSIPDPTDLQRRNKNKVGMRIPAWMITEEMKLIEHYKMHVEVFGLDVPLTQSQPTKSTQGTHRATSAPRSPNPATEPAESSVPKRSTHKSREEQEARENVSLVDEHLAAEEIEKLVENPENVNDSSPPRHDDTFIPWTIEQISSQIQKCQLTYAIPSLVDAFVRSYMSGHILHVYPAQRIVEPKGKDHRSIEAYVSGDHHSGKANLMLEETGPSTSRWRMRCYRQRCTSGDETSVSHESDEELLAKVTLLGKVKGNSLPVPWKLLYTNSKKEKRVTRPSEIHKFCDATLRRTLEGLKSYYNDVKYGYVQKELTNDEVEFLKLFEEEIEVRLNY
ncbi:hypothetical protein Tco_0009467 [Tanacetum coccineum]